MSTKSGGIVRCSTLLVLGLLLSACGGETAESRREAARGSGAHNGGRAPGAMADAPGVAPTAAVPVEVATVRRRAISSFIETNGTLEAENEVDIVGRVSAPVVELLVEEGMEVRQGQLLARLDDSELSSQAEISRVGLKEAELAFERATALREGQLVSVEEFQQTQTRVETARAQYESDRIQLGYTEVRAPFGGLIVGRYIDLAQQVAPGDRLFRLSDFNPLLCPIQVPERDLSKLQLGQPAYLTFEAFPGERFAAAVLRIRPVVDAATGTVRVTLDVDARGRLRPGMFARVHVETETRKDALVIPKAALSLESIGDTVYVAAGDTASRRSVELGFREGDYIEVQAGVVEGERVIIVGQDGLSEGTPIHVLTADGAPTASAPTAIAATSTPGGTPTWGGQGGGRDLPRGPDGRPDFSKMSPEQLERARELMRARGMSEEQIEERLRQGGAERPSEGR